MRIEIEGDDVLMAKLRELDRATQTTALVSALAAGLAIVQQEAATRAPRASGELARNIGAEVNLAGPTKAVGRVAPEKDVWYGIFAELGTRHHAPKPFLRPALRTRRREVERVLGGKLKDFILRAVR